MSSIGFLTRGGETRVSGREHGKFGCVLRDLSWLQVQQHLDPYENDGPSPLRRLADWPDYVRQAGTIPASRPPGFARLPASRPPGFARAAKLALNSGGSEEVLVYGPPRRNPTTALEVQLNSVISTADTPVALAVRLYAQCQANAWIAGPHRAWLADLIDAGRRWPYPAEISAGAEYLAGFPLFADEPSVNGSYDGWQAVIRMLRADDRGTVVLDHSSTDGFPDRMWAAWPNHQGPRFRQWWDTTGAHQRWDASERGLHRWTVQECPMLQIAPDNLHTPGFGATKAWTWSLLGDAWKKVAA